MTLSQTSCLMSWNFLCLPLFPTGTARSPIRRPIWRLQAGGLLPNLQVHQWNSGQRKTGRCGLCGCVCVDWNIKTFWMSEDTCVLKTWCECHSLWQRHFSFYAHWDSLRFSRPLSGVLLCSSPWQFVKKKLKKVKSDSKKEELKFLLKRMVSWVVSVKQTWRIYCFLSIRSCML